MEENKSYRIRTKVGTNTNDSNNDNVININLDQTYDTFEILSLKLSQENNYKLYESDYGIVVGRVLANGGFGIPNAKVSIFIESDETDVENIILYPYHKVTDTNNDLIRYNLLPNEEVDECHQNVGTFPNKRFLLDNDDVIEIFDKYWKYTTTTNKSGDYMLFGIPKGNQTLHVDIDLSDIGILSQRPRDMIYKGYDVNQFESPNKFKKDTNLDSLSQIQSQNIGIYVYPYWGDTSDDNSIAITRCDVQIPYKFEPTCVFMGSIVTDTGSNAIGKSCGPAKKVGKMSELTTGEGTIEMIRKTIDGKTEEVSIKGNRLIDGDGVWCYQIPMNLDYVITDEFGNIVPTDNPSVGIPTRTRVRFRITLDDAIGDNTGRKRCRYLIPNNPKVNEDFPIYSDTKEPDYEFGTNTLDESYCDLLWNNVYSVKNYIPNLQKSNSVDNSKHTGIKWINHYGNNNPMPYNSLTIKLNFTYKILCVLTKVIIFTIAFLNTTLSIIMYPFCQLCKILTKLCKVPVIGQLAKPLKKFFCKLVISCIKLSSDFCDDGVNKYTYYPGCGPNPFSCIWDSTKKEHYNDEKRMKPEDKTVPLNKPLLFRGYTDSPLITCIENSLAQEFESTSFNFSNDWVNGALYAPMWFRKITPKKSFFFGLFRRKAKDQWCSWENNYGTLKIFKSCAVRTKRKISGDNKSDVLVEPQCGNSCGKLRSSVGINNGVIVNKETMLGQTVYYYKPTEYNEKFKDSIMLFATDIILLGNLNKDNMSGIPQFFKSLEPTTYKLPYDILYTDTDVVSSQDEQGNISYLVESDVEMTGCDWGNINKEQECGKAKDGDGGLFYGIGCFKIEMKEKTCINASRICEFGVSLDENKLVANLNSMSNDNDDNNYGLLIPDGFVSYDELYNLDERSMFATMNSNNLRTKLNTKNGLLEYDFNYTYVDNFDGSMYDLMKNRQLPCDDKYTYKHNYNLEICSKDYIKFRFGSNNARFYDISYRSFPCYENSFYFYFGLNNGKTALDKFNYQFFSECKNEVSAGYSLNNNSLGNSWCKDGLQETEIEGVYTNKRDGYIKLDLKGITLPFNITLRCLTKSTFPIIKFENIDKDKLYVGCIKNVNSDTERETINFDGFYNLYEFINFDGINEQFIKNHIKNNELTLDNGQYVFIIEDEEENNNEIIIDYYYKYLSASFEHQNFRLDNETLYNKFLNDSDVELGDEIGHYKTAVGKINELDGNLIFTEDLKNKIAYYNIEGIKKINIKANNDIVTKYASLFDGENEQNLMFIKYNKNVYINVPYNAKILVIYYYANGYGKIEDYTVSKVIDKTYELISLDNEGWDTLDSRDDKDTEEIEFNFRKIGGMVIVYDLFYLGKPLTDNFKIEIALEDPNKLPEYSDYSAVYKIYTGKDGKPIETPFDINNITTPYFGKVPYYSRNIVSDNIEDRKLNAYYFGVPKGGIEYKVTITFLCFDGKKAHETDNKIIYNVLVKEPTKYKMFINGIDYELIKDFKSGWDTAKNDFTNPNISIRRVNGWDNLSEMGGLTIFENITDTYPSFDEIKKIAQKLTMSKDGYVFMGVALPDTITIYNNPEIKAYYRICKDGAYKFKILNSSETYEINYNNYWMGIIIWDGKKWDYGKDTKLGYYDKTMEYGLGSAYNWTEEYRLKKDNLYNKFMSTYENISNDERLSMIYNINNIIEKRINAIKEIKKSFYISNSDEETELIVTVITEDYPISYRICYNGEAYNDCDIDGYESTIVYNDKGKIEREYYHIDKNGEYIPLCKENSFHTVDDENLWFNTEDNIVSSIMIPTLVGDYGENSKFYRRYDTEDTMSFNEETEGAGHNDYYNLTYSFPLCRINKSKKYYYKKPYFLAVKNNFDEIIPRNVKIDNWKYDTFKYSYIKNNLFGVHFIDKIFTFDIKCCAGLFNMPYYANNMLITDILPAMSGDTIKGYNFRSKFDIYENEYVTILIISPFTTYIKYEIYGITSYNGTGKAIIGVSEKKNFSFTSRQRFYGVFLKVIEATVQKGIRANFISLKIYKKTNKDGIFINMNGFFTGIIMNGIPNKVTNNGYTYFNHQTFDDEELNIVNRTFKIYDHSDGYDENGVEIFNNNTIVDEDCYHTTRMILGIRGKKNEIVEYPNLNPTSKIGTITCKNLPNYYYGHYIPINKTSLISIEDEKNNLDLMIYGSFKIKITGTLDHRTIKDNNNEYKYKSNISLTSSDTSDNVRYYAINALKHRDDTTDANGINGYVASSYLYYPLNNIEPVYDKKNEVVYFELLNRDDPYWYETAEGFHNIFYAKYKEDAKTPFTSKSYNYKNNEKVYPNDDTDENLAITLYDWSINGKFDYIDNKDGSYYYIVGITDSETKAISPVYDMTPLNVVLFTSNINNNYFLVMSIKNLIDKYYILNYESTISIRFYMPSENVSIESDKLIGTDETNKIKLADNTTVHDYINIYEGVDSEEIYFSISKSIYDKLENRKILNNLNYHENCIVKITDITGLTHIANISQFNN